MSLLILILDDSTANIRKSKSILIRVALIQLEKIRILDPFQNFKKHCLAQIKPLKFYSIICTTYSTPHCTYR